MRSIRFICGHLKISPFEIEEIVRVHPSVEDCVAFSIPGDACEDVIGLMLVAENEKLSLKQMKQFLSARNLPPEALPGYLVYSNTVHFSRTTLAQQLGLDCRCLAAKAFIPRELELDSSGMVLTAFAPSVGEPDETKRDGDSVGIGVGDMICFLRRFAPGSSLNAQSDAMHIITDSLSGMYVRGLLATQFGIDTSSLTHGATVADLVKMANSKEAFGKDMPTVPNHKALSGLRGFLMIKIFMTHSGFAWVLSDNIKAITQNNFVDALLYAFCLAFGDDTGDTTFMYILVGFSHRHSKQGAMSFLSVIVPLWINLVVCLAAGWMRISWSGLFLLFSGQHFWWPPLYYSLLRGSGFELWWMTAYIDWLFLSPCIESFMDAMRQFVRADVAVSFAIIVSITLWSLTWILIPAETKVHTFFLTGPECAPFVGMSYMFLGRCCSFLRLPQPHLDDRAWLTDILGLLVLLAGAVWSSLTFGDVPWTPQRVFSAFCTRILQICIMAALAYRLQKPRGLLHKLFTTSSLTWLGDNSLLFYLTHLLVINAFRTIVRAAALEMTFLCLVGTFAIVLLLVQPFQAIIALIIQQSMNAVHKSRATML